MFTTRNSEQGFMILTGNVSCRKHTLEALPYVNTAGSLTLMKDIILAGTIPESTLEDWMASLAFLPNPDRNMMESALVILTKKPFSTNIALSIASLAHTFCSTVPNCERVTALYSIVEYYENFLLDLLEESTDDRIIQDKARYLLHLSYSKYNSNRIVNWWV